MSKSLNFNTVKKHYLTITLADENKTTLMICTPTKALMNTIITLQESITAVDTSTADMNTLNEMYKACALLMSRNKGGIKITKEQLEEIFDYEDISLFFNTYVDFITEIANSKN